MSVTILLPSIGREKQLETLCEHLQSTLVEDAELLVILDATHKFPILDFPWINFHITETRGCWRCMNEALDIAKYQRFISLDDDTWPDEDWLSQALACFDKTFPDGLGLVAMQDGFLNYGGAAFPLTTTDWLYVLFGENRFPSRFNHLFLDTVLADRSKDLDRYYFCSSSVVEHRHWKFGKAKEDTVYRREHLTRDNTNTDKDHKDALDVDWLSGGFARAKERLDELQVVNLKVDELNKSCPYATQDELDFQRKNMAKILSKLPHKPKVVMIGAGPGVLMLSLLEGYRKPGLLVAVIDIKTVRWIRAHLAQATANSKTAAIDPSYNQTIRMVEGRDSYDVGIEWPNGIVDYLIIDGDHTERGIKRDMQAWLDHLRPGGHVFFHDYLFTNTPWEDKPKESYPEVQPFVDEEMERRGWKLVWRGGCSAVFRSPRKR